MNGIQLSNLFEDSWTMTHSKISNYFPYSSPKASQLAIMETILDHGFQAILESGKNAKNIMIEAETGSGKTIATLSSLLTLISKDNSIDSQKRKLKIVIFVKTINQMNPILREWKRIVENIIQKDPYARFPLIAPVLGKQRLCNLPFQQGNSTIIDCTSKSFKKARRWKKRRFSKKLQSKNKRNRLLRWVNKKMIENSDNLENQLSEIEQIVNLLQTRENCVYHNHLTLLQQADIIVLTYGYLLNGRFEAISKYFGVEQKQIVVVLDEAHNLALPTLYTIPKLFLEIFHKILLQHPFLDKLINEIRGLRILNLDDYFTTKERKTASKQLLANIHKAIRLYKSGELRTFLKSMPELLENDIMLHILYQLKDFFEQINHPFYRYTCSPTDISMTIIEPHVVLEQLKDVPLKIFQSATLSPLPVFRDLFQLGPNTVTLDLVERDIRKIRKRQNELRASYVSAITSKAAFRTSTTYERYGKIISKIINLVPSHVLVLGSSYDFIQAIARLPIWEEERLNVVIETPNSSPKQLHTSIMNATSKTVIFGSQQGKILEGNEWSIDGRSIVNMVIFAGISTPIPRMEVELQERIQADLLQSREKAHLLTWKIPLYIRAKQALGRTMRHPDDKGAIVILDSRADALQRALWLYRYERLVDLQDEIRSHFAGYSNPITSKILSQNTLTTHLATGYSEEYPKKTFLFEENSSS